MTENPVPHILEVSPNGDAWTWDEMATRYDTIGGFDIRNIFPGSTKIVEEKTPSTDGEEASKSTEQPPSFWEPENWPDHKVPVATYSTYSVVRREASPQDAAGVSSVG